MDESPSEAGRRGGLGTADLVDVLVYLVVLNLAALVVPSVITESFGISILTALMLKAVLEVVIVVKNRVKGRLKAATGVGGKIAGGVLLWVVLAGSKFVVLALEDLLFGDRVELGGFLSVTGLILVLMAARAGVRRLLAVATPVAVA